MADETRAPGGGSLTWLWMLLALLVVAGFLTWLGVASEPSSVAVVEEPEGEEEGSSGGVAFTEVDKDTLAVGKARFENQQIRVADVQATGTLGPAVFWGELGDQSNQVPILIRMDSVLAATGMQIQQGSRYTVTGLVQRMTDSVGTEWAEQGVFADEGAQMQAAFADYYIRASHIRPSRGAGDGAAGGDND